MLRPKRAQKVSKALADHTMCFKLGFLLSKAGYSPFTVDNNALEEISILQFTNSSIDLGSILEMGHVFKGSAASGETF